MPNKKKKASRRIDDHAQSTTTWKEIFTQEEIIEKNNPGGMIRSVYRRNIGRRNTDRKVIVYGPYCLGIRHRITVPKITG